MNTPQGEMLVLGPTSAFQMKLIPLNPFEFTGAGVEIPDSNRAFKRIRETPEFGLRPLSETDIGGFLKALQDPAGSRSQLETILQRMPVPQAELKSTEIEHVLSGPVLMRPDLGSLNPEIMRIQRSLDRTAEETFRRRFPERAGMYL
ncbi:MAG: hypothetical protein RTU30_04285 [Candidatus Thorarchaeota archaeon]